MSANEEHSRRAILSDSYSPARDSILGHLDLESMVACIKAWPEWTQGISSSKIFQEKLANTSLIDTCQKPGCKLTTEYLIEQGADVNMKDTLSPRWSALHLAVMKDLPETCQILVSAGADVNTTANIGNTPLLIAAYHKKQELSRILISGGANPNIQNFMGMTALHWAARGNDLKTVQLLISAGAGLNIQNSKGESPLHLFMEYESHWEMKASVNCYPRRLYPTKISKHEAMMDLLIKNGVDLKLKDSSGKTPLDDCYWCKERKYVEKVKKCEIRGVFWFCLF